MHVAIALTTLALGTFVAAVPTAPAAAAPAKFAIQITATLDKPTSLYLAKGATGAGTTDLKSAAECSISASPQKQLICDGKTIGATPIQGEGSLKGYVDMSPLMGAFGPDAVTDGFAVDEQSSTLHWRSTRFASLPKIGEAIMKNQNGEAQWGLLSSGKGQAPLLYAQLGCPGGTHSGAHTELIVGSNKIVPL